MRNSLQPKLYDDIKVKYNPNDNWEFHASYGDKKRNHLWIMATGKKVNARNGICASVFFQNGEFKEIAWITSNNKMLKDISQVDEKLRQILINNAIELSKKYLKKD